MTHREKSAVIFERKQKKQVKENLCSEDTRMSYFVFRVANRPGTTEFLTHIG